jgi:hypothetical protein
VRPELDFISGKFSAKFNKEACGVQSNRGRKRGVGYIKIIFWLGILIL